MMTNDHIDSLIRAGDTDQAITALADRFHATGDLEACLQIASLLIDSNRGKEAEELLCNIVEANRAGPVLDAVFKLYQEKQQLGKGLALLRRAAYHPAAPADLRFRYLDALICLELLSEAAAASLDFVLAHPGDSSALYQHRDVCTRLLRFGLTSAARVPPVLYIAQGHSARRYVLSELGRMGGLDQFVNALGALDSPDGGTIEYSGLLEHKATGGLMTITPYPTRQNCAVLRAAAIPKLFMTVRDPRQVLYSELVWFEQFPKMNDQYSMMMMRLKYHPDFYELPRPARLDVLIEKRFPEICGFLDGWFREASDPSLPYQFRIFRHDDMKRNAQAFFSGILEYVGASPEAIRTPVRDSQPVPGAEYGEHVLRRGSNDEWREEMSSSQIARLHELIPPGLLTNYGWSV